MAQDTSKPNDQLNKDHNNQITKGSKATLKTGTNLAFKGASFVARVSIQTILRIIKKVVATFASTGVAMLVIIIIIICSLTAIIMESATKLTSDTEMLKESPELTKAYLNTNKDAFKTKIYELVNDKQFNSYVLNGEFDNAYTKLVYGGTSAYSQQELKGYAKAEEEDAKFIKFTDTGKEINKQLTGIDKIISDVNNSSVKEIRKIFKDDMSVKRKYKISSTDWALNLKSLSESESKKTVKNKILNYLEDIRKGLVENQESALKNNNYAKCTPLLEALQKYKDKYHLKDKDIEINDDYLRGYGEASGYKKLNSNDENNETTQTFDKWINNSYYVIPYYFHVNQARNSTHKNVRSGTISKATNIYTQLGEIIGKSMLQDLSKKLLGVSCLKWGKDKLTSEFYKKISTKKGRKSAAKNLMEIHLESQNVGDGAMVAGTGALYAGATIWKTKSIVELLEYIVDNGDLEFGLPNWNNDSGNWQFMTYEKNPTNKYTWLKPFKNYPTIWNNQSLILIRNQLQAKDLLNPYSGSLSIFLNLLNGPDEKEVLKKYEKLKKYNTEQFRNMSYKDILNTGFISLNASKKEPFKYPAQGVLLGYKQNAVKTSFGSTWNEMLGYDGFYDYYAFSKYAGHSFGTSKSDFWEMQDDLYVYDWEDKNGNYEKYLKKVNNVEQVSKREASNRLSVNNTLINTLREQFAQYFINQIYYTYADNIYDAKDVKNETGGGSDYIRDWFLSDTVSKDRKIAFLQRSFYAMASGSSYTYEASEEYTVKDGSVINKLNGQSVGKLDLTSTVKANSITNLHTPISKITKTSTSSSNPNAGTNIKYGGTSSGTSTTIKGEKNNIHSVIVEDYEYPISNGNYNKGFNISSPSISTIGARLAEYNGYIYGNKATKNKYFDCDKDSMTSVGADTDFRVTYKGNISYHNNKLKKDGNTKISINVIYKPLADGIFSQTYKIKFKDNISFEQFFYKNIKWDKKFYDTHKEDIDNHNYTFEEKEIEEFQGPNLNLAQLIQEGIPVGGMNKFLKGHFNGQYPLWGKITGEREVYIDYNTAGFLTYAIEEDKDDKGNVTGVTAGVYMKLPDVNMETRLAYAWEKEGMVENAAKLLDIYDKQKNLKDAESKVDLNELIINYDANASLNDSLDDDINYDSTLPEFINNEMIEAAFKTQVEYGVPCSSTFAQIIAESGFGKYDGLSGLARKNHNLFGMKSGNNRWTAGSCSYATKEQKADGTIYGKYDSFSNYKTFSDSIFDRAELLTSFKRTAGYAPHTRPHRNTRYMKGKVSSKEYTKEKALKFVASYSYPNEPAWATSHEYFKTLKTHMDKYNLYQYDNMTLEEFKSGFTGSGASGSGIEKIINVAYERCNKKPYSQDQDKRKGPRYFDCSGLVWFCFKHGAGIEIGNSTHDQPGHIQGLIKQRKKYRKSGKGWWVEQIPASTPVRNLRRGDVVYNQKHHVVIYLGKNKEFAARDYGIPSGPGKFSMSVRTHIFRFHFPDGSGTINKGVTLTNKEFNERKKQGNLIKLSDKTTCTGYCSCAQCCGKSNGITASGKKLVPNYTCAVDRNIIPLGSMVYVYFKKEKKWHMYEAMDVGGAINKAHIDLAFDSHRKALTWGKKKCKVYFYTPPKSHK